MSCPVVIATWAEDSVVSNLLIYRTCTNDFHYNTSVCELLASNTNEKVLEIEKQIEAQVTLIQLTISLFTGIIPAVLVVFLGTWSDKYGRKPLIILPLSGLLVSTLMSLYYCAFPSISSWYYVASTIPFSLVGGSVAISLGCNLYITDLSNEENRAFRLSLLQSCFFMGWILGNLSSSYVVDAIGYTYLFASTAFIFILIFFYIIFLTKESVIDAEPIRIVDIIKINTVKELIHTCNKSRPFKDKIVLLLRMSAFGLIVIPIMGIMNIEYLFTRLKLQWTLRHYTIFTALNTLSIVFGLSIGMTIFKKVFKFGDKAILTIACVSVISESALKAFADHSYEMYVAASVACLGGLTIPILRSQIAKIVEIEEVGKIFSVTSCLEAIISIIAPSVYSPVYYKTLSWFPGMIFVLSVGILSLSFLLINLSEIVYTRSRNNNDHTLLVEENDAINNHGVL